MKRRTTLSAGTISQAVTHHQVANLQQQQMEHREHFQTNLKQKEMQADLRVQARVKERNEKKRRNKKEEGPKKKKKVPPRPERLPAKSKGEGAAQLKTSNSSQKKKLLAEKRRQRKELQAQEMAASEASEASESKINNNNSTAASEVSEASESKINNNNSTAASEVSEASESKINNNNSTEINRTKILPILPAPQSTTREEEQPQSSITPTSHSEKEAMLQAPTKVEAAKVTQPAFVRRKLEKSKTALLSNDLDNATKSLALAEILYNTDDIEPEHEVVNASNVHKHRASLFQGQISDLLSPDSEKASLSAKIKNNMAVEAQLSKSQIGKFDKFCATIVTLMYLCYPVLIKSTFQLVACMPIGKNTYLQLDLNIRCWEKDVNGNFSGLHFSFVLYLFLPGMVLWVIGMPLITFLLLRRNKKSLYAKHIKFRMGTLYVGYTYECFYWESFISIRKCMVLAASVFLVSFGAETQALAGMMICIIALIFHLHWKPFIPVAPGRDTLFWAEFWALFVAFLTFWTGLFFFQADKPWWSKQTSTGFALELITVNALYMIMTMRWFMILKLMDTSDLIMTKELQGADEKELQGAKGMKRLLQKFVPEWKLVQNLWAKKAWQSTIRHQIMANRSLRMFGGKAEEAGGGKSTTYNHHRKSFSTSAQRKLHESAISSLGLASHLHASQKKKKEDERLEKKRQRRGRKSLRKSIRKKKESKAAEKKSPSSSKKKPSVELKDEKKENEQDGKIAKKKSGAGNNKPRQLRSNLPVLRIESTAVAVADIKKEKAAAPKPAVVAVADIKKEKVAAPKPAVAVADITKSISALFFAIDVNSDGELNKMELLSAVTRRRIKEPKLDMLFQQACQQFPKLSQLIKPGSVRTALTDMDTDKDGTVSVHELVVFCQDTADDVLYYNEEKSKAAAPEQAPRKKQVPTTSAAVAVPPPKLLPRRASKSKPAAAAPKLVPRKKQAPTSAAAEPKLPALPPARKRK